MELVLCVMCLLVASANSHVANKDEETVQREVVEDSKLRIKVNEKEEREANKTSPNIIVILADDLGYGDLSFSGHPTSRTPHIDRLARKSRFFTQYYVSSPVCSPSRASMLTGRLQVRSGVYPGTFIPDNTLGLPRNETTVAALLKSKGYHTMIVGKWHLGVGRAGEYLPTHFGFDHYYGIPYSHDMCPCRACFPGPLPCHDTCYNWDVSCPLYSNTTIKEQPADLPTLTQRLVSKATSFLADAAASTSPFFLYLPFHHVHHPQFASIKFTGHSGRGVFGDALMELDWAVRQVTSTLRRLNLLSSTLLWFSSDNGPSLTRHERGGCAGPLRCGKGTTWEGGVRVPTFVHWPERVSPGRCDGLVSAMDLLPTLASLTSINTSGLTLDGVDVSPLLWDPFALSPRKYMPVYPESPTPDVGPMAVTNGTYKAHFYTRGSDLSDADNYDPMCPKKHQLTHHDPPLLYHLHRDPGERYDLGSDPHYSEVVEDLRRWHEEHMRDVTWAAPRTIPTDRHAQPCCTHPSCHPFPACCDCPSTSNTTTAALHHPNHITNFLLH